MSRKTQYDAWLAEGVSKFGDTNGDWKFVCPLCGHVASVDEWRRAGASEGEIAFSCIGRRATNPRDAFKKGEGPCNYTGGGLFKLNPVTVVTPDGKSFDVFEFADV